MIYPQVQPSRNSIRKHVDGMRLLRENKKLTKMALGQSLSLATKRKLEILTQDYGFSIKEGELQIIDGHWYVTHAGLVGLAMRRKCRGIDVEAIDSLCDASTNRFVLKATVYPSRISSGFVGYGDADPSNVSPLVRGAEMRVAETRAVNRALRKAYGIGLCSVEELGSSSVRFERIPPQKSNGTANENGYRTGPKVRDRLCQLIRQHKLDPELVKAYAIDYCGTKSLKDAAREQVENFVRELAEWVEKDRSGLLCRLNGYAQPKQEEVA